MSKAKATVTTIQCDNPRFDSTQDESEFNYPLIYKVISTTNTIEVAVGEFLKPKQVKRLIAEDVTVNVKSLQN